MSPPPLIPGEYYHIYNRGNNRENIFIEEKNYHYFMKLHNKYLAPVTETIAYCLLRNHFHFLVRIREIPQDCQSLEDWQSFISLQLRNLFSTYAKAINKAYQRTGSLFEKPFKRRHIANDGYFSTLIAYIHQNPQKHGFVDDFRDWPFSSYRALAWFDNRDGFLDFHQVMTNEVRIDEWSYEESLE